MGWLKRLFGMEKPQNAQVSATPAAEPAAEPAADAPQAEEIPPERVGLSGEYDQSGLAKRVALAFDEDSQLADVDSIWIAQTGSTVVLKGTVPEQQILDQMVSVANNVEGATSVDSDQVTVG